MKKTKLFLSCFLGVSCAALIVPIVTSCTTTSANQTTEDYDSVITEAQKHLILEQSAIDLNDMFINNAASRTNEILTYEEVAEKVVVDRDNFIYQKLSENGLQNEFEQDVKDVIYKSYLDKNK